MLAYSLPCTEQGDHIPDHVKKENDLNDFAKGKDPFEFTQFLDPPPRRAVRARSREQ